MSGSTIPAVLSSLTATWQGLNITGLDVVYGFPYDVDTFWVAVAWDRSDQPGVVATNAPEGFSPRGLEEYGVSCLLSLANGDQDAPTTVAELFSVYEQLAAAAISKLPASLGGVTGVTRAWVADYDLTPNATETGDSAELRFTVHVEAVK